MWQHGRRSRGYGGDLYAYSLAIHAVLQFLQQRRTPPVTLALIAVNTAIHFRLGPLDALLPSLRQVCLNPATFLRRWEWRRLILSAFFHVDDTHLIYNMISLLWKGMELETQIGSAHFATMTGTLLLLSHGMLVGVSLVLSEFFDIHDPFYNDCAVGFSAVLFGLKTVLNASQPTYSFVGGVRLPTKFAAWAELLLIQMLVPNASFLGHLCGILAGLAFLYTPPVLRNPLAMLPLGTFFPSSFFARRPSWGPGVSGHREGGGRQRLSPRGNPVSGNPDNDYVRACPRCTFHNPVGSVYCAMCGASLESIQGAEGGQDPDVSRRHSEAPSAPPLPEDLIDDRDPAAEGSLSAADLRRRRLQRFTQQR